MEAAHLRTNYDIVFSFAKSPGVDLNYGFSPHCSVCPSSGFSVFPFFFSAGAVLARWAAARDHKLMARRQIRASRFHEKSRRSRHVRLRSNAQTSFVKSAVRSRHPNAEWTAQILLHQLLREFTADFNWISGVGWRRRKRRKKEISRPERRRNRFIPPVKLLCHRCFRRKRRGGARRHHWIQSRELKVYLGY